MEASHHRQPQLMLASLVVWVLVSLLVRVLPACSEEAPQQPVLAIGMLKQPQLKVPQIAQTKHQQVKPG
jgi:hypothetical protein